MSLKAFHVAFIVAAIGLAAWLAVWGFTVESGGSARLLGALAAVAMVGLVVYLARFLRKMKDVSYL
jgi:L-lactate permease